MGHSTASRLGANGLAMVLPALGLFVSLPAQSGGGWSKAASYFRPPPVQSLSDQVHSQPFARIFKGEPVVDASASFDGNDRGIGSLKITTLPNELVVNILANLSIQDLLVCRHVCKNWQRLVTTVPALACAAYRGCHPSGSTPRLTDTIKSYCGSTRQWLNSFSEQGSKAVTRLDEVLGSRGPHFPEQLFFAIATVLDQAPAFDCRKVYTIKHLEVYDADFSPDQHYFFSYSGDTIYICNLVDGCWQDMDTLPQPDRVLDVYFSPDSKYLVACLSNSHVTIWGLVDGQWQQQVDWCSAVLRECPKFNADTSYLITVTVNDSIQIYGVIDGQWRPQATALDHYPVWGACFHPTDPDLLVTYCLNTVIFWRAVDGRWQQDGTLLHPHMVAKIRFSPDEDRLMTHSRNFEAKVSSYIWHRVGREWQNEAVLPLACVVSSARFSPCGRYIFSSPGQIGLEIWRRSGSQWESIEIPEVEHLSGSCFSPDEQHLTTRVQLTSCAIVWRCAHGQLHTEAVIPYCPMSHKVSFSPHGNHLLAATEMESVIIWGIVDGRWQEKATLPHAGELLTSRFSPQGNYVLTATRDGAISIWALHRQQ